MCAALLRFLRMGVRFRIALRVIKSSKGGRARARNHRVTAEPLIGQVIRDYRSGAMFSEQFVERFEFRVPAAASCLRQGPIGAGL